MTWDEDDYYVLACGVGRSRRYHAAMREFYRRCADAVTVFSAISGTSAFVSLFLADRSTLLAQILTGLLATASILNLVFGFSKKADLHDRLMRDFTLLAADIESWPADPKHLAKAKTRRISIEADEPTVRRVIDLRAQNDEWRARGVSYARLCPLSFLQRRTWLPYFFDFGLSGVETRIKERDAKAAAL